MVGETGFGFHNRLPDDEVRIPAPLRCATGCANTLTEVPSLLQLLLRCKKLILRGPAIRSHTDLFLGINPMLFRLNSRLSVI